VYFRFRLDDTPLQSPGNLKPFGWGIELDANNSILEYEFLAHTNGTGTDNSNWFQNTVQAVPDDPSDPAELLLQSYLPTVDFWHLEVVPDGSNFGGNPDYFFTIAIRAQDLTAAGISVSNPIVEL